MNLFREVMNVIWTSLIWLYNHVFTQSPVFSNRYHYKLRDTCSCPRQNELAKSLWDEDDLHGIYDYRRVPPLERICSWNRLCHEIVVYFSCDSSVAAFRKMLSLPLFPTNCSPCQVFPYSQGLCHDLLDCPLLPSIKLRSRFFSVRLDLHSSNATRGSNLRKQDRLLLEMPKWKS